MTMRGGACAAVLATVLAGTAYADKKTPGLFDFGSTWKTPVGHERDAAKELAPGGLDLSPAVPAGEPRVIRVRFYVDRDYRSLVLRWQGKLRAQIQRVNAVVTRVFNVRFEIESLRDWDRSHVGAQLEPILGELEALDPAREVDLVIGVGAPPPPTPLQEVVSSIHQIGVSRLLARHFVLRGMDDDQEIRALEREFKLISPEERQRLYEDRKAHKEVVVFLHEWGHTLGLLHNEDRSIIMNPAYHPRQASFSDFEKRQIALVVARRLARPTEAFPETADLPALLATAPRDEGSDQERADLAAVTRGRGQGAVEAGR
jgi:hypothetical protein